MCLFVKKGVEWDEDLLINGRVSIEMLVQVGMGIGRCRASPAPMGGKDGFGGKIPPRLVTSRVEASEDENITEVHYKWECTSIVWSFIGSYCFDLPPLLVLSRNYRSASPRMRGWTCRKRRWCMCICMTLFEGAKCIVE